jgi:hypothetical protein
MAGSYWKMVAENVAKGLGPKTVSRLGVSGRVLARTGALVGAGFMAYELLKSYKDNIENEPAYQEMTVLQQELEKWGSAISCIGRQPYEDKEYGSLDEGGAINALYKKKLLAEDATKPADTGTASELIQRAEAYIKDTANVLEDGEFDGKRADLVHQLEILRNEIDKSNVYVPIQKKLSQIVSEIKPIESAYSARIYDCSREIQKNQGSNVAWAAVSMVTLGFVKKPKD